MPRDRQLRGLGLQLQVVRRRGLPAEGANCVPASLRPCVPRHHSLARWQFMHQPQPQTHTRLSHPIGTFTAVYLDSTAAVPSFSGHVNVSFSLSLRPPHPSPSLDVPHSCLRSPRCPTWYRVTVGPAAPSSTARTARRTARVPRSPMAIAAATTLGPQDLASVRTTTPIETRLGFSHFCTFLRVFVELSQYGSTTLCTDPDPDRPTFPPFFLLSFFLSSSLSLSLPLVLHLFSRGSLSLVVRILS